MRGFLEMDKHDCETVHMYLIGQNSTAFFFGGNHIDSIELEKDEIEALECGGRVSFVLNTICVEGD